MCHAGCDMLWFWMILAFICWCEIHLQLGFDYTSDFRLQILGLPVKRLAGDSWVGLVWSPRCWYALWPLDYPDGPWRLTAFKDMMLACSSPKTEISTEHPKSQGFQGFRSIQIQKEPRFEGMPVTSCCHWYHTPVKLGYQKQPQVPTLTQTQARQILQIGGSKLFNTWITWFMFNPIWEEERKWLSYFQGSSKRSIRPCGHNPVT